MKTVEINGLKLQIEDGLEVVIDGGVITVRARTIQPNWWEQPPWTHPINWGSTSIVDDSIGNAQ